MERSAAAVLAWCAAAAAQHCLQHGVSCASSRPLLRCEDCVEVLAIVELTRAVEQAHRGDGD